MSATPPKKQTRAIEKEIEINAPIATVWKALTEAKELTQWFPLEAGENPDGTRWMAWRNEFKFASRIEIWEPPHHVRTAPVQANWSQEKNEKENSANSDDPAWGMATDFYLEARGGATVLRLVHSGFSLDADWDALYDGTATGWNFQLWALRHYLENHRSVPRCVAFVREFLKNISREAAWQMLFGTNGLLGQLDGLRPGERYTLRTAAGDEFTGVIHSLQPPHEFSATVENLNAALLRVHLDELFDYRDVNFQLSAYGISPHKVEALEARMRPMLQSLNTAKAAQVSARKFETEISINAPVEAVWKALTDAEELTCWFPQQASVTPGAGGKITLSWPEITDWNFRIEEWKPDKHLCAVYDLQTDVIVKSDTPIQLADSARGKPLPLAVDYFLEGRGGATVLRLVHSGFGNGSPWDEEYDGISWGWLKELRSLRHYLEYHRGQSRHVGWARVTLPAQLSTAAAWQRLLSEQGVFLKVASISPQEGDPCEIHLGGGESLQAVMQYFDPPNFFCARVENLQQSFMRAWVWIDKLHGFGEANLQLSTYGLPKEISENFEKRGHALLRQLFG
ncbi:MAG: hypothetical protein ALAOOOJD_03361 [bacterium]|nr:hypothetical protein [bacterium]